MARVKRGVTARQRHKKVLKLTKGHRGTRHSLYRRAHESMLHALAYSYAHRKELKGDMRRLWIVRLGAAARENGISYSQLVHGLKLAEIQLDRKVLSDLAISDPAAFAEVVGKAKNQLAVA
ncbi:MAG: 50S ribosomal protein L20 [Dehalococcoidia bacterium]|nr:50S ribosomal protein L20 [Dehalococcoidia bacterium]